ncbi:hypothetical protein AVEN_270245-1, partial [Araneus ventricosus]
MIRSSHFLFFPNMAEVNKTEPANDTEDI